MNYNQKDISYFSEERGDLYPFFQDFKGNLLDIGCGIGGFINGLKNINHNPINAWGIEPNINHIEKVSPKIDRFLKGTLEEVQKEIPLNFFDCITFNDVLEHLYNPAQILLDIKPYLSKNGYVFASIPNFLFFPNIYDIVVNQKFEYTSQGILDNTHIRFFTKNSIIKLFLDNGYEIEFIQGINFKLFEQMRLYKFLNIIFFNKLYDFRYMQFVIKAKIKF
jgi:2-polyprenyl-3-methyl-5-hydroxy-6-metoxy-1,4-benzoquinol methylase